MWHDLVNGAVRAWTLEHEATVMVLLTLVCMVAVFAVFRPRRVNLGKYMETTPAGRWRVMDGYSGTAGPYRPETPHQVIARLRAQVKGLEEALATRDRVGRETYRALVAAIGDPEAQAVLAEVRGLLRQRGFQVVYVERTLPDGSKLPQLVVERFYFGMAIPEKGGQ